MSNGRRRRPAGGSSGGERIEPTFDRGSTPRRNTPKRRAPKRSTTARRTAPRRKSSNARRRTSRSAPILGFLFRVTLLAGALAVAAFGLYAIHFTSRLPDPVLLTLDDRPPNVQVLAADGTMLAERGLRRGHVRVENMPPHLIEAVIATEDRRFYSHFGVDPLGLLRAAAVDIMAGAFVEGGSTITQQLAKNLFLKPDRTIERKIEEMVYAIWLERRFDKNQIMELYLNRVYFGGGAYGVEAASRRYFGKSATELTLTESALLAGLLKAPSTYAPTRSLERASSRLGVVLNNMVDAGFITEEEAKRAAAEPLGLRVEGDQAGFSYIVDWVAELLPEYVGEKHGDLIVTTSIDPVLQKTAQKTLREKLESDGKKGGAREGAVVVLGTDGAVRALVGGRSYQTSPYNRAVKAKRQPGSAFKPFVYLAAMEAGYTPNSIAIDSPIDMGSWAPKNYKAHYYGEVTLRTGLEKSLNSVAVKLIRQVGPKRVVNTAHRMGIESELGNEMSLALGTSEVSLLELTAAYAPFANGGMRAQTHVVNEIRNADDRVLYRWKPSPAAPAIGQAQLSTMNDMMNAVVVNGTGRRAGIPKHVAGGKTGTTQSSKDAWFVGYTAHYIAGIWIGNDDNSPMKNVTGGTMPAEIWHDVMMTAHRDKQPYGLPGTYTPGLTASTNPIEMGKEVGKRAADQGTAWVKRMLGMFGG